MLGNEIPPFDVLTSQVRPFTGFGDATIGCNTAEAFFVETEAIARQRVAEVFEAKFDDPNLVPQVLDRIIERMWSDGWQPQVANINLFATDFGCILTDAVRRNLSGTLIFRSANDLSHASIWWSAKGVEAFSFHKTFKRLLNESGESIALFASQLATLTQT